MNIHKELSLMLKRELLEIAERLGLKGVSKLKKEDLIKKIEKAMKRERGDIEQRINSQKEKEGELTLKEGEERESNDEGERDSNNISKKRKSPEKKKDSSKEVKTQEPGESVTKIITPPTPQPDQLSSWAEVIASKYRTTTPLPQEELRDIDNLLVQFPDSYNEDKIVLLPRDPAWAFCYWSISSSTFDSLKTRGAQKLKLMIYKKENEELIAEFYPEFYVKNWYIPVPEPDTLYYAKLGAITPTGEYLHIMESNVIKIPPASPSTIIDDKFITIPFEEDLRRLFPKKYKEVLKEMRLRYGVDIYSYEISRKGREEIKYPDIVGGRVTSPGAWSGAISSFIHIWSDYRISQPQKEEERFDFQADVELIVYGKIEKGGKVFIAGEPVEVDENGNFSGRLKFPIGKYNLPVLGISSNKKHRKEILFNLERHQ